MDIQTSPAPIPAPVTVPELPPASPGIVSQILWGVVVSAIIVAAAYGAYAYITQQWPFAPSNEPVPEVSATPTPSPEVLSGTTYTSEAYGFQMRFPETWDAMVATPASGSSRDTLCFSVPKTGEQGFCLLQLSIYTPVQWEEFKVKYEFDEAPLAQNSTYVVVAEYSLDGGGQYSEFQKARSAEVPGILATFKFK